MEGQLQMVLIAVGVLLVLGILAMIVLVMKRTAYLGPVKEELQKEKLWLQAYCGIKKAPELRCLTESCFTGNQKIPM